MRYHCEQVTSHHRHKGFCPSRIHCMGKFLGTLLKLQWICQFLFLEQPQHETGANSFRNKKVNVLECIIKLICDCTLTLTTTVIVNKLGWFILQFETGLHSKGWENNAQKHQEHLIVLVSWLSFRVSGITSCEM